MKRYVKYIILILLLILCVFLVWNTFIRKNPRLDELENNMIKTNIDLQDNKQTDLSEPSSKPVTGQPSSSTKPIIGDDTVKPNDETSVIISSETEVLNEQGQKLLDQLSKQLDQSFNTIKTTDGIVDDDILDESQDIK